jgi:GGDEF domain-containing protein
MSSKIRNIAIFTIIFIVTLTPYYIFRSDNIEKKYISGIITKSEMIRPAAEMLNREASPDPNKVKKLFNEIMDKEPSAAALALTDRFDSLKYLIKNDGLIRSGTIVDLIISDIKEKNFNSDNKNEPFVRNYNDGTGGSERFYIYPFISGGQKTFAVFAFKLERKTLVRLALEVLLLISFSFMLTGMALTLLRKKGLADDPNVRTIVLGAKKTPAEKPAGGRKIKAESDKKTPRADQIDENDLSPIIGTDTDKNSNEMIRKSNPETESAIEALNARIFDLFKQIHKELKPESIALYIKKMEGRLSKTYELKEKTFLRIDSSLFDNIKISEIENIKRSGAHVIDDGKVIRIALIDDESLLGLIEIRLKDSATSLDLGRLQTEVKDISKDIKEFLVINNVIVDRETGFYSSSYFNMKLSEQIYSAQKISTKFHLLLIDVFRDVSIDKDQKNTVLKIIYPVIKKSAGETLELFLHSGKIAIILPEVNLKDAENIELAVTKDISRFRIKLSPENTIRLKPAAAIMSSSEAENVKEILKEALELFETEN